jgi:hypothetical protein
LGITALAAYSVGSQNAPVSNAPVAAMTSPSGFGAASGVCPEPNLIERAGVFHQGQLARQAPMADTKRKVEAALTAAAIAAVIVQASRGQYHSGGRPCACPDDTMRNGRACGGRSAYSRPVHGRRASPFLARRHFSDASSFQTGVSRGRRIASSGTLARVSQQPIRW